MISAKNIIVKPIKAAVANKLVKQVHYSGRVVNNSTLHLGVYLNHKLEGAMSFGGSMKRREMIPLVTGTQWNGFLELNRMAFTDKLPRNSESRALAIAFRLIRQHYPHIEWVVSFADSTQCGDGTIYRAAGFHLLAIKKNNSLYRLPDGRVVNNLNMTGKYMLTDLKQIPGVSSSYSYNKNAKIIGAAKVPGYQIKYIYFLNPAARARLTVPVLPYSQIDVIGAGMYKGKPKQASEAGDDPQPAGTAAVQH
jgi:hypothetical protein